MNTLLHMATYAVNLKWYAHRQGRVPLYDEIEVRQGFLNGLKNIYVRRAQNLEMRGSNL